MFYRLYALKDGRVGAPAAIVDAPDDRAAVDTAKRYLDGHDMELWHQDRLVARLYAHEQPRARKGPLAPF